MGLCCSCVVSLVVYILSCHYHEFFDVTVQLKGQEPEWPNPHRAHFRVCSKIIVVVGFLKVFCKWGCVHQILLRVLLVFVCRLVVCIQHTGFCPFFVLQGTRYTMFLEEKL